MLSEVSLINFLSIDKNVFLFSSQILLEQSLKASTRTSITHEGSNLNIYILRYFVDLSKNVWKHTWQLKIRFNTLRSRFAFKKIDSMNPHFLFWMVKTGALCLVSTKNYSKNIHWIGISITVIYDRKTDLIEFF